ncbi:MAG: DUF1203 domain-containing protein [Sneathiella sp.]
MKTMNFIPIRTTAVRALQEGGNDSHGNAPEVRISDGDGLPCRHCLDYIPEGEEYLILSYKPFSSTQPYAEQGPIFLHRKECHSHENPTVLPKICDPEGRLLIRGYSADERIVYGTGKVVQNSQIETEAQKVLDLQDVAYIHVRSASNNCYQFRIEQDEK